jgi:hypothetical protein
MKRGLKRCTLSLVNYLFMYYRYVNESVVADKTVGAEVQRNALISSVLLIFNELCTCNGFL